MARKVFISFLGTNNYVECIYDFGPNQSRPVRFVQEALISKTCKDWTAEDRIFIFCTTKDKTGNSGSKELNWLDNGHKTDNPVEKIGLKHRLDELKEKSGLLPVVEMVEIEAGFSEDEIWNIFNAVYKKLEPNDEIFLDVTHAFRSIPLFSLVLFNYSKFLLGSQLTSVVYGAFEKLGAAYQVRSMPLEERIAPVVDLMNIVRLQEYTQIAVGLRDFGKIGKLTDVIKNSAKDSTNNTIKDLAKSISELDEFISTNDLKQIRSGKFINKFRNSYKNIRKKNVLIEPIKNILMVIDNETSEFVSGDDLKNIEIAINWTIKHDMLMQTYPMAEEYFALWFTEHFDNLCPKDDNGKKIGSKNFREYFTSLLGMPEKDFVSKNWGFKLAAYPELTNELAETELIKEFRTLYCSVKAARNSLAHGNGSITYGELKNRIATIVEGMRYLNPEYIQYPSTKYILDNLVK